MPTVQTAPPRLIMAPIRVGKSADLEMGVNGEQRTVRYALDLELVISVREYVDFENEYPGQELCIAEVCGAGDALLLVPFADVLAAWQAYRTHADALGRLRN